MKSQLMIACLLSMLFICLVSGGGSVLVNVLNGWTQLNGNAQRSRCVSDRQLNPFYNAYAYDNVSMNSMVMNGQGANVCFISNGVNSMYIQAFNGKVIIDYGIIETSQFGEMVSIQPLIYKDIMYTIRRNNQTNAHFVLKTTLIQYQSQHEILFDTMSNIAINDMILTDDSLILVYSNWLVSIDLAKGTRKWLSNGFKPSKTQLLYYNMNLYILTNSNIGIIDLQNGSPKQFLPIAYTLDSNQQALAVGNYITTFTLTNSVYIFEKTLKGYYSTLLLRRDGSSLMLDQCTNALSFADSPSFYMVCKSSDSSYSAFKFDIKESSNGIKLALGYQIDFSSLFGMPVKYCTNQIVATGRAVYSILCDAGLITFGTDEYQFPRRQIFIPINSETQIFGTSSGNVIAMSYYVASQFKLFVQVI